MKHINQDVIDICNRHILVFGKEIQNLISSINIGIISVGGIGLILIELLMRLFPNIITFIDKDIVEKSNLNRLVGATLVDVIIKTKKTDLASRNILKFNSQQNIRAIDGDFLEKENQEKFKECDFIIGCSDSNAVRIATNRFCLAHGITYLDCGVGAIVKDGILRNAGGQIIIIKPDSDFCLHCSGMFDVSQAMKEFLSNEEKKRQENEGYIMGMNIIAPQVYALNMSIAAQAVWLFMRMISGENIDFDGIAIDAKNFMTYTWKESIEKINDCTTCGHKGIVFEGDNADLLTKSTK